MPTRRIADLVLESATDYAIITMDLEGKVTSWNKGAQNVLGWTEDEILGRPAETFFTPADRAAQIPQIEMGNALTKGRGSDERWHIRKDGTVFWATGEMLPLRDDGPPAGFLKILRDRTREREAQELQNRLNHELSHRMKNQLAMVQAIVAQSLKSSPNIQDAQASIMGRLGALSRAHDVLLDGTKSQASLVQLIGRSLEPFLAQASQVEAHGPDVTVNGRSTLSLSLLFHELATNAVKYGALSSPAGTVRVTWQIVYKNGDMSLRLTWIEAGGPHVQEPSSRGFGTRLLSTGVAGAETAVELKYRPEGFSFTLTALLRDLQDEEPELTQELEPPS